MASQRANVTKASGLYTYISEVSAPEGSQVIADNVNINERDVITPRRGNNDYGAALPSSSDRVKQVLEYKDRIIRHYNSTLEFDDGSGTFTPFDGSYLEVEPNFRIKSEEVNGNFYFTSSEGIKKISARNASEFKSSSGYIVDAGAPKAVDLTTKTIPSSVGFLPPESKVAYKILWGYKDKNNVLVLGSPSTRNVATNTSKDLFTPEIVTLTFLGDETASPPHRFLGKYFLLNTVDKQYYIWYNDSGDNFEEPINSDTLGKIGIKVEIEPSEVIDNILNKTASNIVNNISEFDVEVDTVTNKATLTSNEEGVISPNASNGDIDSSFAMSVSTTVDASVSEGTNTNVELSFIVPNGVTSDYFYQIYRTSNITATEGLTLNDIDPGEECNLVIENPVGTNVPGDIITITDSTPSTFRDVGAPLYNNPLSGQGLLQTNDRPPIAKDIEKFSNYTFYSNTKTYHRTTFNIVSVDDFGDKETSFYIGNEDGHVSYTFQGVKEQTTISCGTVADTRRTYDSPYDSNINESWIDIYSANDDTRYYIWFDKGDDEVSGTIDAANDWIDSTAHPLQDGDVVTLSETDYYVINANTDDFQLSLTRGGSAITITDLGADSDPVTFEWNTVEPDIEGALGIRVDLTRGDVSPGANLSVYLEPALATIDEFDVTSTFTTVTVTNIDSGSSTDASSIPNNTPSSDIGTGWGINVDTQGLGEDAGNNYVKWSLSASVGQAIEETARSLVKVINQDVDSPVNAFYLSGENDLPGKVLLENKSLEDIPFYIAISTTGTIGDDIGGEFNPTLPIQKDISLIQDFGTSTTFTSTSHGISIGDEIYTSAPNNDPVVGGLYEVTATTANTFTVELTTTTPDATGAVWFYPDVESDNEEKPNRLYYSKLGQPEAAPLVNFIDIGGKDKPIERILALRDNLFVLKEDGTYIVSGTAPFNVRLLDNTSNIVSPDSAVVLNNQIYCLNEDGVVTINETGVSLISRPIENLILDSIDSEFDYRLKSFGVSYESDKAYFIWLQESSTDEVATQVFRYNVFERTWTRWTVPATCGYVNNENKLFIGDGTREYLLRERKNKDRTDFADRNFTRTIGNNAINGNDIIVSTVSEIEEGDVITQVQGITISLFNSTINKLEIDPNVSKITVTSDDVTNTMTAASHGLNDNDRVSLDEVEYYVINSTVNTFQLSETQGGTEIDLDGTEVSVNRILDALEVSAGVDMDQAIQDLNTYLINIGLSISMVTSGLETITDKYNLLIDELNSVSSGTRYKNYRKATSFLTYESIITDVDTSTNTVTVLSDPAFLQGEIEVYKAIKSEIQWNPLHFGDPSSQKQFSKGTVIVDQNNFTFATVSYSTDISQGFVAVEKRGSGVGYWGSSSYGGETLYWGGNGNDVPILSIMPREKQRGRYQNVKFQHAVAREQYRILGVTTVVRVVSDRGYR